MFSFFALYELYLSNKEYFFFDGRELLPLSTVVFLFAFIVLSVSYFVIGSFSKLLNSEKLPNRVHVLFVSITTFLYIHGNYNITDYGAWDGRQILWEQYKADLFLWILIALVFVVAFQILYSRNQESFWKYSNAICTIILLVQLVTICTLAIQNGGMSKKTEYVATTDNAYSFSENENIIVLVVDSFDSIKMDEVLEKDKSDKSIIPDDFTYYPNTVGKYSFTNLAIPYILSGIEYHNDKTYGEYLRDVYIKSDYLNLLQEKDYRIGIYSDMLFPDDADILYVDNIREIKRTVTSHRRLGNYLYKMILFRYIPQPFKQFFYYYPGDMESEIGSNVQGYTEYSTHNNNFMRWYVDSTVTTDDRVFELLHIYGTHQPYQTRVYEEKAEKEITELDVCRDNLLMINGFLDKLKQLNVYDCSTIIICADHGSIGLRSNPLFMIKYPNEHHDFIVDDIPFSYSYIPELMVELINKNRLTVADIAKRHIGETRFFVYYDSDRLTLSSYNGDMIQYSVDVHAHDMEKYVKTGVLYCAK